MMKAVSFFAFFLCHTLFFYLLLQTWFFINLIVGHKFAIICRKAYKDRKLALLRDALKSLFLFIAVIPEFFKCEYGFDCKICRLISWERHLDVKRMFIHLWRELLLGIWELYLAYLLSCLHMLVCPLSSLVKKISQSYPLFNLCLFSYKQ